MFSLSLKKSAYWTKLSSPKLLSLNRLTKTRIAMGASRKKK